MAAKKTINDAKVLFRKAGLRLLSKHYQGSKFPMDYRCLKCGREDATTLNAVQQGHACNSCGPMEAACKRRDSLASVRERFAMRDLVLLSEDYQGTFVEMPYRCLACGHVGAIVPNKVPRHGCKECGNMRKGQFRKLTDDSLEKLLATKNLKQRDFAYTNCFEPIGVECNECGKHFSETPARIRAYKYPCPECRRRAKRQHSQSLKKTHQEAVSAFLAVGLDLLARKYYRSSVKMPYRCRTCGYMGDKSYNQVTSPKKTGCWRCGKKLAGIKNRLGRTEIENIARAAGVTFLRQPMSADEEVPVRFNKCGHEGQEKSPQQLKRPRSQCSVCSGKLRKTEAAYIALARMHGGELVWMAANAESPSLWRCGVGGVGHLFPRSYSSIVQGGESSFCTVCTTGFAEMRCQAILQKLFGEPFPKRPLPTARSLKGRPLQIDMFNERLRLAIEHHGVQHFKAIEFWGGESALAYQQKRDQILRDACARAGITLVEVRQLGEVTSPEDFRKMVALACSQAKPPIPLPLSFWEVDLEKVSFGSASADYWTRTIEAAARLGFTCLSTVYAGAIVDHDWICSHRHAFRRAPRQILYGRNKNCPECYRLCREKPVLLSDGRCFGNETVAAAALETRKSSVNSAVRRGHIIAGLRAWRISQAQFSEFSADRTAALRQVVTLTESKPHSGKT